MTDIVEQLQGAYPHVEAMNLEEVSRALNEAVRNMDVRDSSILEHNPAPCPEDSPHVAYVKTLFRHISFLQTGVRYDTDGVSYRV